MKNEKLQKYEIHEKFKMSAYFISEKKKTPKNTQFFQLFTLYFKGPPFQYHKVRNPNYL